ncbi:MAG TPA: hypothetical protein PLO13_04090 [Anaerolineaceae bacterium]|nr:hypothetical protein [Anaerolineaceae bacterium]HQJ32515.1 hypothetical protein [Anaerolineaceae bacterium]
METLTFESGADVTFKPTAIVNYKATDDTLAHGLSQTGVFN